MLGVSGWEVVVETRLSNEPEVSDSHVYLHVVEPGHIALVYAVLSLCVGPL